MQLLKGLLYCLRRAHLYRDYISLADMFKLFQAEHVLPKGRLVQLKIRYLLRSITIRARTSDCILVRTVLLQNGGEYPYFPDYAPRFIIDAGANIGLASAFFKAKYPTAKIVAIEPDEDNCRLFEMNTRGYGDIHLLRGALWPDAEARLRIRNPGEDAYAYQVEQASDGLQAVTIPGICAQFKAERIDILKIDIEGAERELFSSPVEWIDKTDNILIETHDGTTPGASKAVLKAVGSQGFSFSFRGENVIFMREWRRCRE